MKNQRMKKEWGGVLLGGIFLCNPIVFFLDVLPDAVGLALLLWGLYRVADLDETLARARRGVLIMLAVAVAQLVAVGFISDVTGQNPAIAQESPMLRLLGMAAYAFFACYYLIPALRSLYLGAEALAVRTDGELASDEERLGYSRAARMARRATVFVLLQMLLAILPELSVLASMEFLAGDSALSFDLYRYAPLFRTAAAPIAFGFGVWFLVGHIRFCSALRREDEWNRALDERYRGTVASDEPRMERRRYLAASLCIGVGLLFAFRIKFNALTALPSAFCALGLWCGMRLLSPCAEKEARPLPFLSLGVASVLQYVLNLTYLRRFVPEASRYREEAYWHFLGMRLSEVLEAVLLLWALWSLLSLLEALVQKNLCVTYEGDAEMSRRATERLQRSFAGRLTLLRVGAVVVALGNLVYALFQLYLPWMWFVNLLLMAVEFCLLLSFRVEYLSQLQFYGKSDADA